MRTSVSRWLAVVMALAGATACAEGAAPYVESPPVKPWTGIIDVEKGWINGLALAPDGRTLIVTNGEKASLWDLHTGKCIRERTWRGITPRSPAFVSQGKEVAFVDVDERVAHVLASGTLKTRAKLEKAGADGIDALIASPDGAYVVGWCETNLAAWDVAKGKLLWQKKFGGKGNKLEGVAYSPDGKLLALAVPSRTALVRLHDAATGRELKRMQDEEATDNVRSQTFACDGRLLVTAGLDEPCYRAWDVATGKLLRRVSMEFSSKDVCVSGVALSPDGKTLAVSCFDGIRLYEIATWGLRHTLALDGRHPVLCPRGRVAWMAAGGTSQVAVSAWRGLAKPRRLNKEDLSRIWDDLDSKDAAAAHKASEALLASPDQAVDLLARVPGAGLTRKKLARFVADLDDDDFDVRETATAELKKAGHVAETALGDRLVKGPALEGRRRIGKLLNAIDPLAPQRLRFLRAVEVLETIGSPAARKHLERLGCAALGEE